MSKLDAALLSNCCAVKPSPEYMMTCSAKYITLRHILPTSIMQHLLQSGFWDAQLMHQCVMLPWHAMQAEVR